jgi:hypothetical protein
MKKHLTPEKIQRDFSIGDISKENAADLLISLIEGSDDTEIRVESIKALEKLNFRSENIFKKLENYMISDENAIVRASVTNFVIQNYLEDGIPALKWATQHEKSPLVLKEIFDFMKNSDSPVLELIKNDLVKWNEGFSSKMGVVPQESLFFLDLEALFAKGKKNYELNPSNYKNFQTLSDIKNGEPWLVIRNKHVEILNFNYFRWKFIINNSDIVDSLSKLQDLDVYLCSLRRYSHSDIVITSIPESIGSLIYLKKLTLRRNSLRILPYTINKLTLLRELDISNNKFEEIPQEIISLNSLEKLNIKHNLIQCIPESLSHDIKVIR